MNPKLYNLAQWTVPTSQLVDFVRNLDQIQADLVELVIASKQRQGFPEATTVINHIQGLK